MALPGSKAPLPGYKLIVDSNGNYIDDVPNIRLGSEFVLSRNAADPSANISVAAYIAAQIAAAIALLPPNSGSAIGRLGSEVLIDEQSFTGTTYTGPSWTANKYRSLRVEFDYAGSVSIVTTLTGISGTYSSNNTYYGTSMGFQNWAPWTIPSVPTPIGEIKIRCLNGRVRWFHFDVAGSGGLSATGNGSNTDTSSDVTNIVLTASGSSATKVSLWGVPA